jgi:heme/copper-type cytochrome/quinol oxidase subunit 2
MPAEDTVFSVLYDKFMFWSILVGVFTFGWLFYAMARYRQNIEPDTTDLDHIVVGSFPVERHNTKVEVLFYVLPTILVVWMTMLALSSNTAVWVIPDEDESFNMEIIGQQWFWEFNYKEELTWQDDPRITGIDVSWGQNLLIQFTSNPDASNITISLDGADTDYALNSELGSLSIPSSFDRFIYSTIEVKDSAGNVLHTWGHIPISHELSTASGEHMIVPCDEEVVLSLFSYTSDYSELNSTYWGVQHALWLPEWGVKEDIVPGLEGGTIMWFMADDPGTFDIRCAEYCGLDHSKMAGKIDVVSPIIDGKQMNCDADTGIAKSNGGEN